MDDVLLHPSTTSLHPHCCLSEEKLHQHRNLELKFSPDASKHAASCENSGWQHLNIGCAIDI